MKFGQYELLEEVGRGGAGIVYRARQLSPQRIVALKVISSTRFASERERDRFVREASIASRLDHPGIVPVYEVGVHEGSHYFTMALEEGGNLEDRLADGPLEPREAAQLLIRLCEAMHYAHGTGIVHRDLKPENVLFDASGNPRIADFGLAKEVSGEQALTLTGELIGTPGYMAPEQVQGISNPQPATDVYALGCILYACLTGRPPFRSSSVVATLHDILDSAPAPTRLVNPSVPRSLDAICLHCLEKAPDRRYPSARDLADDLRAFLDQRPVRAEEGHTNVLLRMLAEETRHTDIMARWSSIGIVHAALNAALFAATGALLLAGVPPGWSYMALWVPGWTLASLVPVLLRRRRGPLSPLEEQLAYVWLAFAVAVIVGAACHFLTGGSVFGLVPFVFISVGLAVACMSILLRGSFYSLAVACAVCALGSALGPPWVVAPLGIGLSLLHFDIARRAGALRPAGDA